MHTSCFAGSRPKRKRRGGTIRPTNLRRSSNSVSLGLIGGEVMFKFGMGELVIILLIVLLLFGAARLPEIARSIGKSIKEFKKGFKEIKEDNEEEPKNKNK